MNKIKKFFTDVLREMKLVTWPNRHDIKEGTVVVIVMSAIVGIFLAFIDLIFTKVIDLIF